jgi:hypothetical protein
MQKRRVSRDDDHRAVIAGFTRQDFERVNRLDHAKNLRCIIKSTKWLNDHGAELMRLHPQDFSDGAGMTAEAYVQALAVHIDRCHQLLKKVAELKAEMER